MWDQTDGCAKQYRCSIDYYMISFLSKSYQTVLDGSVDTQGHGKDVVNGFNAFQTQYLANFLRMHSTPEVYNIDSKPMPVDAMTKKGKVRFYEECKPLLDICAEIGTKGDEKHVK